MFKNTVLRYFDLLSAPELQRSEAIQVYRKHQKEGDRCLAYYSWNGDWSGRV